MAAIDSTAGRLRSFERYLQRCGYARGVVAGRISVARDWLRRHPDLSVTTFRDVEAWLDDRSKVGPGATRNLLIDLRALYVWAQREGLASSDPTTLVKRPRLPKRLPRPAPTASIAAAERDAPADLRAALALAAMGGARCCELSRLDWPDFDFEQATVRFFGKGARERSVDLSADALRAVVAWRLASPAGDGAVFVNRFGRRRSPAAVSQWLRKAFDDAGHPKVTGHQLRHRCATDALQQPDAELLEVRDLLGHASVATTEMYTAVLPGRTAKVSRGLCWPAA